jgi:hypothetical protein
MLAVLIGAASGTTVVFALCCTVVFGSLPRVAFAVLGMAQRASAAPQKRSLQRVRGAAAALDAVSVFTKLGIASSDLSSEGSAYGSLAQPKMR